MKLYYSCIKVICTNNTDFSEYFYKIHILFPHFIHIMEKMTTNNIYILAKNYIILFQENYQIYTKYFIHIILVQYLFFALRWSSTLEFKQGCHGEKGEAPTTMVGGNPLMAHPVFY